MFSLRIVDKIELHSRRDHEGCLRKWGRTMEYLEAISNLDVVFLVLKWKIDRPNRLTFEKLALTCLFVLYTLASVVQKRDTELLSRSSEVRIVTRPYVDSL